MKRFLVLLLFPLVALAQYPTQKFNSVILVPPTGTPSASQSIVCNNNSGDAAKINTALSTNPIVVYVAAGTCSITGPINIAVGQTLKGAGRGVTILNVTPAFLPTNANGIIIGTGGGIGPNVSDLSIILAQPQAFTATTNAITNAGGTTISLASAPANFVNGDYCADTTSSAIPVQTTCTLSGTTLTLGGGAQVISPGVGSGNTISFSIPRSSFVALGTCNGVTTGCHYPAAFFDTATGGRPWLDMLHIEGAWIGIDTEGGDYPTQSNTVPTLTNLEVGAIYEGWRADNPRDDVHVVNWKSFRGWGFAGSQAWTDGGTYGFALGRVDGFGAVNVQFFEAGFHATLDAGSSATTWTLTNWRFDGIGGNILIESGKNISFVNLHKDGQSAIALTCPTTITGGLVQFFAPHFYDSTVNTVPSDSTGAPNVCVSGGTVRMIGGYTDMVSTAQPEFSCSGGTMEVEAMHFDLPNSGLNTAVFAQSGGCGLKVVGNTSTTAPSPGASAAIVSIGADVAGNFIKGNYFPNVPCFFPGTGTPNGFYECTAGNAITAPFWGSGGIGLTWPAATYTDTTGGSPTTVAVHSFAAPVVAASSAETPTNLATLYVGGATNGTNMTATNLWSIFAGAGIYAAGKVTSNGLLSGNSGATINGGAVNVLGGNSNNFNVLGGSSTGTVNIGNVSDTTTINLNGNVSIGGTCSGCSGSGGVSLSNTSNWLASQPFAAGFTSGSSGQLVGGTSGNLTTTGNVTAATAVVTNGSATTTVTPSAFTFGAGYVSGGVNGAAWSVVNAGAFSALPPASIYSEWEETSSTGAGGSTYGALWLKCSNNASSVDYLWCNKIQLDTYNTATAEPVGEAVYTVAHGAGGRAWGGNFSIEDSTGTNNPTGGLDAVEFDVMVDLNNSTDTNQSRVMVQNSFKAGGGVSAGHVGIGYNFNADSGIVVDCVFCTKTAFEVGTYWMDFTNVTWDANSYFLHGLNGAYIDGLGNSKLTSMLIPGGVTTDTFSSLLINGTQAATGAGTVAGLKITEVFAPTTATNADAIELQPHLGNASANIANYEGVFVATMTIDSSYTGTTPAITMFEGCNSYVDSRSGGIASHPVTNFYCYSADPMQANNGITSGTAHNYQYAATSTVAAAGSGGTLTNVAYQGVMPAGSSTGTTNYGLLISGNGGGSANANWGIAYTGTAMSELQGGLTLGNISTGTNADFLCLSSGGVVLLQSSACTISSRRYKEHLARVGDEALAEILSLEVTSFNVKEHGNRDPNASRPQIGLIAENVAEVEPKCAIYEDDMKTPKSYRPECITALLVKATQDQAQLVRHQQWEIYGLGAWCLGLTGFMLRRRKA